MISSAFFSLKPVGRGGLGRWRARTTFVLALAAAAVGLGNLWRFSYLAGTHGGGAFVLTYVACLFLVAVPVLIAEVVVGRQGRGSPVKAIEWVSRRSQLSRGWSLLGVLACVTGTLLLSYLVVVAGWSLAYAWSMYAGVFSSASAQQAGVELGLLLGDFDRQLFWQSCFVLLAGLVALAGVRRGLGTLVWLTVPSLFSLLVFLVGFALDQGDVEAAREFLFSVKLVDFTAGSVMAALGHAFFTLGIGVGVGISFGAYSPRQIPIGRSVLAVAVFDTLIALLAGLAIFPLVFASNIEPSMGPGLLFVSLPYAFGNMLQGDVIGMLFFLLVALALLGTATALLEPGVGALVQWTNVHRPYAVLGLLALVWLLSRQVIASVAGSEGFDWYGNRNLLGILDQLTAGLLLPLVSLLTAVYAGWRLKAEKLRPMLVRETDFSFAAWRILLRYIVPPAALAIVVAEAMAAGL